MSDSKPGSGAEPRPDGDAAVETCPVPGQDGRPTVQRPPVTDWRTDWDHLDPRWRDNPFPIWDELREGPIARTERFEGAWLPTRYEDVRAIAYDTDNFTSRRVVLRHRKFEDPPLPAPPLTSDPPEHKAHKQVLLPFFTPREVGKLEPLARRICNALIDGFIADGSCDAAQQYARHVPVRIIAYMLGVPIRDSICSSAGSTRFWKSVPSTTRRTGTAPRRCGIISAITSHCGKRAGPRPTRRVPIRT